MRVSHLLYEDEGAQAIADGFAASFSLLSSLKRRTAKLYDEMGTSEQSRLRTLFMAIFREKLANLNTPINTQRLLANTLEKSHTEFISKTLQLTAMQCQQLAKSTIEQLDSMDILSREQLAGLEGKYGNIDLARVPASLPAEYQDFWNGKAQKIFSDHVFKLSEKKDSIQLDTELALQALVTAIKASGDKKVRAADGACLVLIMIGRQLVEAKNAYDAQVKKRKTPPAPVPAQPEQSAEQS